MSQLQTPRQSVSSSADSSRNSKSHSQSTTNFYAFLTSPPPSSSPRESDQVVIRHQADKPDEFLHSTPPRCDAIKSGSNTDQVWIESLEKMSPMGSELAGKSAIDQHLSIEKRSSTLDTPQALSDLQTARRIETTSREITIRDDDEACPTPTMKQISDNKRCSSHRPSIDQTKCHNTTYKLKSLNSVSSVLDRNQRRVAKMYLENIYDMHENDEDDEDYQDKEFSVENRYKLLPSSVHGLTHRNWTSVLVCGLVVALGFVFYSLESMAYPSDQIIA